MGTVTFQFHGICVNFRGEDVHRVLLQQLDRDWLIDGHFIPPHRAMMTVPNGDQSEEIRLAGCRIQFGTLPGERPQPEIECIPNLTRLMLEKRDVPLTPPATPRVDGDDPRLIACLFEFPFGLITGVESMQAASTLVTVTMTGALTMNLVPFPTSDMAPRQFVLPEGSRVSVSNMASPEGERIDQHFHFLLSYLPAEQYPVDPVLVDRSDVTCPVQPAHDWTAGASCSNSNYP